MEKKKVMFTVIKRLVGIRKKMVGLNKRKSEGILSHDAWQEEISRLQEVEHEVKSIAIELVDYDKECYELLNNEQIIGGLVGMSNALDVNPRHMSWEDFKKNQTVEGIVSQWVK